MKTAVVLSFVAAVMAGVVEKRDCHGNNCARQVTGTRDGLLAITSRQADCSSFMKATVTPEPTTFTVTITVDEDEPPNTKRGLEYRAETALPTLIPAYASSCEGGNDYSSACSCWGITATTVTAPQPTQTTTVTVTQDYCDDL
ncbi:hypothetical protein PT974_05453 [Cladobotryum mycophilum]|uniref:Uncharacterized protein n=1 Tax=Cladobotryum mycophilum TaxID=491253 RepID=A0ABR0SJN0_9HYPO